MQRPLRGVATGLITFLCQVLLQGKRTCSQDSGHSPESTSAIVSASRSVGSCCKSAVAASKGSTVKRFPRSARPAGFEPATGCLEGSCSVRLSYGRPEVILHGQDHTTATQRSQCVLRAPRTQAPTSASRLPYPSPWPTRRNYLRAGQHGRGPRCALAVSEHSPKGPNHPPISVPGRSVRGRRSCGASSEVLSTAVSESQI